MKLFVNLTARALVASATDNTRLGTLPVKQGDVDTLQIVLLTETGNEASPLTVTALPAGFSQLRLGARTKSNLEEDGLLFSAVEFVASGAGSTQLYTATLHLDTEEIAAKFPEENLTRTSLEALLDMELLSADESTIRTVLDQWPVSVSRDILRDTEGVPTTGNPMLRAIWMPGISDGLTGGDPVSNLDGVLTANGRMATGALVAIPHPATGNAISFWQLKDSATTTPNDTTLVCVPDDFAIGTNQRTWRLSSLSVNGLSVADTATCGAVDSVFLALRLETDLGKRIVLFAPTIADDRVISVPDTDGDMAVRIRSGSVVCAAQQYVDVAFFAAPDASYAITQMTLRYTGGGTPPLILAVACISAKTLTGFRAWFTADATTDYTFDYAITL